MEAERGLTRRKGGSRWTGQRTRAGNRKGGWEQSVMTDMHEEVLVGNITLYNFLKYWLKSILNEKNGSRLYLVKSHRIYIKCHQHPAGTEPGEHKTLTFRGEHILQQPVLVHHATGCKERNQALTSWFTPGKGCSISKGQKQINKQKTRQTKKSSEYGFLDPRRILQASTMLQWSRGVLVLPCPPFNSLQLFI